MNPENEIIENANNALNVIKNTTDIRENRNSVATAMTNLIFEYRKLSEELSNLKITNVDLHLENCNLRSRITDLLLEREQKADDESSLLSSSRDGSDFSSMTTEELDHLEKWIKDMMEDLNKELGIEPPPVDLDQQKRTFWDDLESPNG